MPEVVRVLIEHGADVNVQITSRACGSVLHELPLHVAASRGLDWLPTLVQLINCPTVKLDATNSDGMIIVEWRT